jgi:hypothetical protein
MDRSSNVNYSGSDTFTYRLEDTTTHLLSNVATVTINIAAGFTYSACTAGTFAYPYGTAPDLTSVFFNESEVLRAFGLSADGKIVAWYNDEHALTLGVRRVVVIGGTSPGTTDYPVSALASNPGAITNPAVGTTFISGPQAGTDTAVWNLAAGRCGRCSTSPTLPTASATRVTGRKATGTPRRPRFLRITFTAPGKPRSAPTTTRGW